MEGHHRRTDADADLSKLVNVELRELRVEAFETLKRLDVEIDRRMDEAKREFLDGHPLPKQAIAFLATLDNLMGDRKK